jgi:DNA primase
MSRRILCPKHKEETPSCVLYPNGKFHCYGCGAHGLIKEIGEVDYDQIEARPKYVENVAASVDRIRKLPRGDWRGLHLHHDADSFYILWPDLDYYKRRLLAATSGDKYRCPAGVRKPLFHLHARRPSPACVVVEGELNALSVWECIQDYDVICPGGCGDIQSAPQKHAQVFKAYERIEVYTDEDAAGAAAAIRFKAGLLPLVPTINIHLLKRDFNDELQEEGKDAVKARIQRDMGV